MEPPLLPNTLWTSYEPLPLYIFSPSPDIIMRRRRTVSKGYATVTDPAATVCAMANLVPKLGLSTISLAVS